VNKFYLNKKFIRDIQTDMVYIRKVKDFDAMAYANILFFGDFLPPQFTTEHCEYIM